MPTLWLSRSSTWLLWCGLVAVLVGLAATPVMRDLHGGRAGELLILGGTAALLGWPLARMSRGSMASALLLVWGAAHAFFAGPAAVLAVLVLVMGGTALGSWLVPERAPARGALAMLLGLAVIAAAAGWLLPYPLHHPALYGGLLLMLALVRRRQLRFLFGEALAGWRSAVADHPAAAAWAVTALGLASTPTWLPTLQFDDLAYHLGLPWQLQTLGYYRLDAASQVWALAPWGSDVLHGIAQLLADREARGSLNLAWLLASAGLLWSLCRAIGLGGLGGWLAVALFASLPVTAVLAGGMQTEGPGTAYLLATALLIQASPGLPPRDGGRWLRALGVLAGALLLIKLSFALALAALGLWWLWRWRGRLPWPAVPGAVLLGLFVAGSSYAYAWLVAGNPVLPLFNSVFASPLFPAVDFQDPRYVGKFSAMLPWELLFDSGAYYESWRGVGGFQLIGLAGALLAAIARPDARGLALAAAAVFVLPLTQVQYLRYAYPGIVLLIPPMLAGATAASGRRMLIAAVFAMGALNLAFQPNASWILRGGGLKTLVLAAGDERALIEQIAPHRLIARELRARPDARILVVALPYHAELAGQAFSASWYDHALQASLGTALSEPAGPALQTTLTAHGLTHVLLDASAPPGLAAALAELGAVERARAGEATLWSLPAAEGGRDLMAERDLARRFWQP